MDAHKIALEAIECKLPVISWFILRSDTTLPLLALSQLPEEVKFILEEIRLREEEATELQESVDYCVEQYAGGEALLPFGVGSLEEWIKPDIDKINELADQNVELAKSLVNKLESKKGKLSFHVGRYMEATGGPPCPPTSAPVPATAPSTPRILPSSAPSPLVPSTAGQPPALVPPPSPSARVAAVNSSSVKIKISSPRRSRRRSEATKKQSPAPFMTPPLPKPRSYPVPPPAPSMTLPDPSEIPPHPGPPRRGRGRPRLPSPPPPQGMDTPEPEDPTFTASEHEPYEEEEDTRLYCFCRQMSHGEFHLECVGRSEPPPKEETWYCSNDCAETSPSYTPSSAGIDPHTLLKHIEQELIDLAMNPPNDEPPIPEAGPSSRKTSGGVSASNKKKSPRRNRKKKT
ncbi:hypothetical protein FRC04_005994 [Tulasnella sp. 424]|nr:hypothetical protein FRC04_005994 [Tulasnella sp. 424]KAG8975584.1 hypothetical protein FRC05_005377 [Tulasnella sp. 425]